MVHLMMLLKTTWLLRLRSFDYSFALMVVKRTSLESDRFGDGVAAIATDRYSIMCYVLRHKSR